MVFVKILIKMQSSKKLLQFCVRIQEKFYRIKSAMFRVVSFAGLVKSMRFLFADVTHMKGRISVHQQNKNMLDYWTRKFPFCQK
jgi:hypothetical protein